MVVSAKQFGEMLSAITELTKVVTTLLKVKETETKWIVPKGSGINIKDFLKK